MSKKEQQEKSVESHERQELTYGQKLIGIDFNPSGDPNITKVKQLAADMADVLHDNCNCESEQGKLIYEQASVAILQAQMLVIKSLTFKY